MARVRPSRADAARARGGRRAHPKRVGGLWQGGTKGTPTYDKGTIFNARSEIAAALPDDTYKAESGVQFTKPKARRR